MIRKLTCRNLKSWREPGPIGLAPLTVFFGANGSGKSSLLGILPLLQRAVAPGDRAHALELADTGRVEPDAFAELLWRRDLSGVLELGLEWKLPTPLHLDDPARPQGSLLNSTTLEMTTSLGWRGRKSRGHGRVVLGRLAYGFAGGEIGVRLAADDREGYELFHTHRDLKLKLGKGHTGLLPAPADCHRFPAEATATYENLGFVRDLENRLEERLARLFALGARLEPPKRRITWSATAPCDVGAHGERALEALLAARETGQTLPAGRGRKRQNVAERVVEHLRGLGLLDSLELRPLKAGSRHHEAWVRRHPGAAEIPLADAGTGIAQVLPVVTLCYYAPEGSTLILERPETALDPTAQAGLADVLIDAVASRGVQVLVESQSEHLLRRLQRRVAEERIKPRQLKLYACASTPDGSQLTELVLDGFGAIASWPEGLFDHEFAEIQAMALAALERQTRATR